VDRGPAAASARFRGEAATDTLVAVMAVVGTIVYAVSAARYWTIFRHHRDLLPLRRSLVFSSCPRR
jgi:hypothetical protein